MGSRGPKPTPTITLRDRGSWRADLRTGEVEPAAGERTPPCPKRLRGEARRVWRRLAPKLHRAGLLTEIDVESFAAYCDAVRDYLEADRQLAELERRGGKAALVIQTEKGNVTPNPLVYIRSAARKEMQALAAKFGLTPSDRVGVRAEPKIEKDKGKSRFFKGA